MMCLFLSSCGPAVLVDIEKANVSPKFSKATVSRVAVIGFDKNVGIHYNSDIIADKFTAELVNGELFSVVDRNDIDKIFAEVGFQEKTSGTGLLNDQTKKRLQAMGADSVLTGKLIKYKQVDRGDSILVSEAQLVAKLLRIETGEVLWSAEISERSKMEGKKDAMSAEYLLSDIIEKMSKPLKSEGLVKKIGKNINFLK
jgi:hypothetical protein